MTTRASGTFNVRLAALPLSDVAADPCLGRRSLDKDFHGDLEGTSKGEMLSAGTPTAGSAGYVAMERVVATLHGQHGAFVLQHSATMNRGVPALSVTVVPDSGTEELTGLTGQLQITIADGKHSYDFDYTLPARA